MTNFSVVGMSTEIRNTHPPGPNRLEKGFSRNQVLGAFTKLQKGTVSFVMSARPSVRPHGTTVLPLDGFL